MDRYDITGYAAGAVTSGAEQVITFYASTTGREFVWLAAATVSAGEVIDVPAVAFVFPWLRIEGNITVTWEPLE